MPTTAVYLKANVHRALVARGLNVDPWVRGVVADAVTAELDGDVPPDPNYTVILRRQNRIELLKILRDVVEEGTVLDVDSLTKMIESVE